MQNGFQKLAWQSSRLALLALTTVGTQLSAQTDLETGFKTPPNSAKPRTWMHAMSGNMSKAGMSKDLEAIAAAGQGGVLLFNIATGIPYGDVPYNSARHHENITHAAEECERLDLSFGVHNCDGWSSSGGPWITPEQSMKMVVWSETVVDGGRELTVQLPQPTKRADFYQDIAVVAYPALTTEVIDAEAKPTVTASDEKLDIAVVTDNRIDASSRINQGNQEDAWILFDYGSPHTIRSAYLSFETRDGQAALEVSDDGEVFTFVKDLRTIRTSKKEWAIDDQFEPLTARYFRLKIKKSLRLQEVNLRATRQFDNYLRYTGYGEFDTATAFPFSEPDEGMTIKKDSLINLTSSLGEDGSLQAKLPHGKWTLLRFGYTSTNAQNTPASKWGRGLECDKFSRAAFKAHFDAFCQRVIDNSQASAPNALQYLEIDSYEMGGQNWTDDFETIFQEEKGYDLIPFLPAFAGRYVESADAITGFVYDLNDLYCQLMTRNYFQYFTELCNENGLQSYVEPYGGGPVSTLDISGHIDLPMTEFWMGSEQNHLPATVSGAHIYGKKVISAESFTSRPELNWKMHPALAKSSGDKSWTGGVNEFMFHRFVHQPNVHVEPGMTMGQWGSHIDRTQTWWMNAGKAWFGYIARGSYLLRQGYPVADVLVFEGDGPHKGSVSREKLKKLRPTIPAGINYDSTNADVLMNRISIVDDTLVLPEGNAYRYLIVRNAALITLPSLRRIKDIVDAGVTVVGRTPEKLAGYQISDEEKNEFRELCDSIWQQPNCSTDFDFSTVNPDFLAEGRELDFMHRRTAESDIYFFHNETDEAVSYDCTFRVANRIPERWDANTGEVRKLANFESEGANTRLAIKLEPLESAFIVFRDSAKDVLSIVNGDAGNQFEFVKDDTVEIISTKPDAISVHWSNGQTTEIPATTFPEDIVLNTDWEVEFLAEHNFAAKVPFPQLTDWKDHSNEAIKYYAGTANYAKSFTIAAEPQQGLRYQLNLGSVDVVAEVSINGQDAGILWVAPFTIDITDYLQKGENKLVVQITNQWSNRLIGDQNFASHDDYRKTSYVPSANSRMPAWFINNEPMPRGPRSTFCTGGFYRVGDELSPSGLNGPVTIQYNRVVEIPPPPKQNR